MGLQSGLLCRNAWRKYFYRSTLESASAHPASLISRALGSKVGANRVTPPRILAACDQIGRILVKRVYGDTGGAWVDETTPTLATQPRSLQRLAAEQGWRDVASESGAALHIFRLPGIYGPGRSTLDRVADGSARRIDKPKKVQNPRKRRAFTQSRFFETPLFP